MIRLLILSLLTCNISFAQEKSNVSFAEENYDFGTVNEEDGPITFDFEFINNGVEPLVVLGVKPSCGCTTPSWTSEPISSGGIGIITAQYNPRNRPGAFRKSLTVSLNNSKPPIRLYINGNVIPRNKTKEEKYPYKFGALRFASNSINLGLVTTEKKVEKSLLFFNDSDSTIEFKANHILPDFIEVKLDSSILESGSEGKLTISYNPNHADNLGFKSHSILLKTKEETDSLKEIHVMASIVEFFPPLSNEEFEIAPKFNIENRVYDFGKVTQGNFYETEFILTNQGKSNLNIRKIKSNCGCLTYTVKKYDLVPNETVKLVLKLNTKDRRGGQIKNVTIYTNDPIDPTQLVTIKANVVID